MDYIRDSIDKITNPTDNSFNEKCSRIRRKRGKPKRVKLDWELVVYH
ncbi:MAG TPA: hypothetical protein VKX35_08960 [Fermentimonas sp.]|nr:hypothetical protein [Fermentimonas sp.]